ncbi:helix-turn-helix domain-containing protein [Cohnella sp. REN36]|uniref:response regulator transcription factor n=1 Tax=Cohnella sp. REN36 TaxID=2887347 RepID=UPI001D14C585|nr:helix-turn-helix domain-containing protein [Cohnella sp. REN36]MCC3372017.1 response regulator [Cohnella sp. REN36]
MYRLLIVDDEEMITDGLYETLSGQDLGLDLYKAYSGREALAWLHRTRVDIVLSDLRMPGIDGMRLLSLIKTNWPHCRIIFLTGYSDFDSVYQAIQTPGVHYLLKSEGYPKVISAVRQAIAELDESLRMANLIQQSKEKLNTLEVLARGNYFQHHLHGVRMPESLDEDFRKLGIPLDPSLPVFVALGDLSQDSQRPSYANRQEAALAVTLLAETFLSVQTRSLGMIDRFGDLVWLIQPRRALEDDSLTDDRAPTLPYLEGQFELIQQACTENLDYSVAVSLGDRACEWKTLSSVYEKIRRQRQLRIGDGAQLVQTVPLESGEPSCTVKDRSPREKSDALTALLDAGRRDDFFKLFDEMTSPDRELGAPHLVELYYTIALVLLSYVNRWELEDKVPGTAAFMRQEEHPSWAEAFAFLRTTADRLFELRRTGERNRAAEAIGKVRAYIDEHLAEDLSLVRLAGYTHFNPSYLSRLFKQECGFNLSEYIEAARIERAKTLLKQEERKVSEIGVLVGYEASQSFTRFFKKATGVTPQDYREAARQ